MFFSPEAILDHLKIYLPRLTDLFSTNTAVQAEILDGTPQVLCITKSNHGLLADQEIITINGLIDNSIVGVQDVGDIGSNKILRFITAYPHDLTLGYILNVTLSGFTDTGLNNTFKVYSVPSRAIFEIVYSTVPTLTGSEVVRQDWENGINGKFVIDSVAPNSFDILLTGKPTFQPGSIPQLKIVESNRMTIAADFDRAQDLYTQRDDGKNWLFVIMGSSLANKDRNSLNDAIATNTAQNPQRIKMINTFTINTILNTVDDLAAADASQISWTDILFFLMQAISGNRFETFGNSNYTTTLIDHGIALYNKAFYGHGYIFEYVYEITDLQTFIQEFLVTRAYRDSALSFAEIQDGSEVNLDQES